tara:strand:- start:50 stop:508 length:459 start_codon:yes stop_codon:yes gene_type:complete
MKTITEKDSNISLRLLDDSLRLERTATQTKILNPKNNQRFIMNDCGFNTTDIHVNVPDVSDWATGKYKYDGSSWSANTDHIPMAQLTEAISSSTNEIPVSYIETFLNSGTVKILDEQITYTGKEKGKLTGCTRGANSTTAAAYQFNVSVIGV